MIFAANSSIQHSTEKLAIYGGGGTWHLILSECFWPPLFQKKKKRISRRIDEFPDNFTSFSIFTSNTKQFLWKYHIVPTLIWTALVFLRSKQRYVSHEQFTHWTEKHLLQLFLKLQTRQNLYFKTEMFSSRSKNFVYRKLKRELQ